MESSKLVSILKQFNEKEWKAFRRLVDSPYFNRRRKLLELLDLIKKARPKWAIKKLAKTYIYSKLFPNEKYVEKRLVEMRNALVKLIEQYLLISKNVDATEIHINLATAYHQKGLYNYSTAHFEKSLQSLDVEKLGVDTHHRHLVNHHLTRHYLIEKEGKRNQEPNLQALHNQFDAYYLCTKLKYYCKVLNYQNFRSHHYNIAMIDEILQEAIKEKYHHYPAIQIYYHGVYTLLDVDNEKHFYALKKLLKLHTHTFSKIEMENIFIMARNFCAKNYNLGRRKYTREIFELYKIEIEESIIFKNHRTPEIPDSSCRNIIKSALRLNETQWAISFLKTNRTKITNEVYTLSLANVYFHQQKYKTVLELLQPINFKEVLLELAARSLILKTYFQLCRITNDFEYEDNLEAYIESFNIFLKRKKEVLTKGYLLYLNLIKFTHTINKLYWSPKLDKNKLMDIHQKILTTPETAEWDWLKEISKGQNKKAQP